MMMTKNEDDQQKYRDAGVCPTCVIFKVGKSKEENFMKIDVDFKVPDMIDKDMDEVMKRKPLKGKRRTVQKLGGKTPTVKKNNENWWEDTKAKEDAKNELERSKKKLRIEKNQFMLSE